MILPEMPFVRVTYQRGKGDCAIVCIAMMCGVPYEDALDVATQKAHRRGMYLSQIIEACNKLGVVLKRRRKIDWDNDTGILNLDCKKNRTSSGHVAFLRWGLVFDTELVVWEPEAFLSFYKAKALSILVREE